MAMDQYNKNQEIQKSSNQLSQNQDFIERVIGPLGKFQLWICGLIFLTKFPVAWHQMAIIFLAPTVSYHCVNSTQLCPCDDPVYDTTLFPESIVMTWGLICDKAWLKDITQTFFQFGVLSGSIIFGALSDRYGRKIPLILTIMMQVSSGVLAAFMKNFWWFTFLRFLLGASVGGIMVVSFVICMELVGNRYRDVTSALYQIPFNCGHLTLPGFAYYFRDWHNFQLSISFPVLLLLCYYWFIPESPRWLLAVNRDQKAIKILEKAANMNNLPSKEIRYMTDEYQSNKDKEEGKRGNVLDLFKTPNIRRNIIGMAVNWTICSFCFYGVSQYVGTLSGNIFINVAMNGAIAIPATLLSIALMKVAGRKPAIIVGYIISSLCLLAIAVIPERLSTVRVVLACIGNGSTFIVFVLVYLYASEMFPTVIRNSAVGFSSMFARVGSMIAPFVSSLNTVAWISPLIFGITPLIGILFCLTLPETKGLPLITTIEEGENLGLKSKIINKHCYDNKCSVINS